MNCEGDNCTKTEAILYKLVTGKRGRPPHKHFCTECASRVECIPAGGSVTVHTRMAAEGSTAPRKAVSTIRVPDGFSPACAFLLTLMPDNLFEPVDRSEWYFRCKGCGETVTRSNRKAHFEDHKGNSSIPADNTTEKEVEVAA